jgi:ferritin
MMLSVSIQSLSREEQTRRFLDWFEEQREKRNMSVRQVSLKGRFDAANITRMRSTLKGAIDTSAGGKEQFVTDAVVKAAAQAFEYTDSQTLELLQDLQLVPGGNNETRQSKSEHRVRHWTELLEKIEDDAEQERITGIIEAIIRETVDRAKSHRRANAPATRDRAPRR